MGIIPTLFLPFTFALFKTISPLNTTMNIYVANLDSNFKNEDLKKLFSGYGEVVSAEIAMDGFTDLPRGFGFVEMPIDAEGMEAIAKLNQSQLNDRTITVQVAKPKENHRGSYRVGNGVVKEYRFRKS
jgi:RNA recognition motif-containing protein